MPNTREKLIELFTQVAVLGDYLDMQKVADHLIANGVTVDECIHDCVNCWKTKLVNAPNRWIPVKERLPEEDGDYLIYATVPFSGRKFMAVMHYEKDAYLPIWLDTTHWMPLPEPPKGE